MADNETIAVSRRFMGSLGWVSLLMGAASSGIFFSEPSGRALFSSIILLVIGLQFVLSARNVRQIVIDKNAMTFLPVGAQLCFSDIDRMIIPDWADRFDTPPNAVGSVTFETNTATTRYVPGAILQWKGGCRINFAGSDGIQVVAALRKHHHE